MSIETPSNQPVSGGRLRRYYRLRYEIVGREVPLPTGSMQYARNALYGLWLQLDHRTPLSEIWRPPFGIIGAFALLLLALPKELVNAQTVNWANLLVLALLLALLLLLFPVTIITAHRIVRAVERVAWNFCARHPRIAGALAVGGMAALFFWQRHAFWEQLQKDRAIRPLLLGLLWIAVIGLSTILISLTISIGTYIVRRLRQ